MNNLDLQKLPLKWKVIISSVVTGLVLYVSNAFTPELAYDTRFLGLSVQSWKWGLFFGCMLAWSELLKKDFQKAAVHFAAGMGAQLLFNGYLHQLPQPFGNALGYILIFFPFGSILLLTKRALTEGKEALNRKSLLEIYIAGLLFNIALLYLPLLLLEQSLAHLYFLEAPLFYWMFYRLQEGKKWKELIAVKEISKAAFAVFFFLSWSMLMFGLYNLSSVMPFFARDHGMEEESALLIYAISQCLYLSLSMLLLGYLCISLLASWHLTIKKPLGWLYLLSLTPLINLFTVVYLLFQKEDSWGSSAKWHEYLESERNKFAVGLVILTIAGSFISVFFAVLANNGISSNSLYISLLGSGLSALTVHALYKGWGSFWTVGTAYIVGYGALLLLEDQASQSGIAVSLMARFLGMLIYYQAIHPAANKPLQQKLATA